MTLTADTTTTGDLFDRHRVIDVDTHLTEPPDAWTRSFPASLHDKVPHIERIDGRDTWMVSGNRIGSPGFYSMAGHDGVMPASIPERPTTTSPRRCTTRTPASSSSTAKASTPRCSTRTSAASATATSCASATESSSPSACGRTTTSSPSGARHPNRLIAITALPFWDLELALAEIDRCLAMGHRAINFCNQPQDYGMPPLAHPHWDPIWARAQEAGIPVNFHVGGGSMGTMFNDEAGMGWMTNFAKVSSLIFLDNMRCVADLIFGGVCHRFPDLKFVSVESGVGWVPGALETFDWQWRNGGIRLEHPEYDLLPSEYYRRQIYGCFWFEEQVAVDAIAKFPDNILFETDYPHPTCQHPGPQTPAQRPRQYADRVMGSLSDDVVEKILWSNAAALYGLD